MSRFRNQLKLSAWRMTTATVALSLMAIAGSLYFKDGMLSASAQLISQAKQSSSATDSNLEILGTKDGIIWGTATLDDSARSGILQYSVARVGATGYFYGSYKDPNFPETYFANLSQPSACGANKAGYTGLKSLAEATDVSQLNYTTTRSILVGDQESGCYTGLLVIRQETPEKNGKFLYMVIEPLDVDKTSMKVRWWANIKPDVKDFSKAPPTF